MYSGSHGPGARYPTSHGLLNIIQHEIHQLIVAFQCADNCLFMNQHEISSVRSGPIRKQGRDAAYLLCPR